MAFSLIPLVFQVERRAGDRPLVSERCEKSLGSAMPLSFPRKHVGLSLDVGNPQFFSNAGYGLLPRAIKGIEPTSVVRIGLP